jgi:hypothetical protein
MDKIKLVLAVQPFLLKILNHKLGIGRDEARLDWTEVVADDTGRRVRTASSVRRMYLYYDEGDDGLCNIYSPDACSRAEIEDVLRFVERGEMVLSAENQSEAETEVRYWPIGADSTYM